MDQRLTPANDRVAATFLKGKVEAPRFSEGTHFQVTGTPFLHDAQEGRFVRQLLSGDDFQVYDRQDGWAFGQSLKDGYVGYVEDAIVPPRDMTHRVQCRSTWIYPQPDIKQPALDALHFNSRVQVLSQDTKWARISLPGTPISQHDIGFVPLSHLSPLDEYESDPVAVAMRFLETPYVWAGNTGYGIDCSGLVQAALLACGIPCPGDSDMQQSIGTEIAKNAPLHPGDLLFWKGHVAMVANKTHIIHANAQHMAVVLEGIDDAITRIADQGDGPVTARRRL